MLETTCKQTLGSCQARRQWGDTMGASHIRSQGPGFLWLVCAMDARCPFFSVLNLRGDWMAVGSKVAVCGCRCTALICNRFVVTLPDLKV